MAMKRLRIAVVSFSISLFLSLSTLAVLAACDPTFVYKGKTCVLVGENCSGNVCVCAYNCGVVTPNEN